MNLDSLQTFYKVCNFVFLSLNMSKKNPNDNLTSQIHLKENN